MSSTTESGKDAEQAGEAYLVGQGYRVRDRNVRTRAGEIDRIAWDGDVLCFVEIRSRGRLRYGLPEETVGAAKQARLARAAAAYLQRWKGEPPTCRFDVLAVDRTRSGYRFRLFRDAFTT